VPLPIFDSGELGDFVVMIFDQAKDVLLVQIEHFGTIFECHRFVLLAKELLEGGV
jgi:hypothetical protein